MANSISLLSITTLYIFSAFAITYNLPQLTQEDGIIEYLSALTWLIGLLITSSMLYSGRFKKRFKKRFIIILFSLICFLSLGEEISWGQRILDIDTPEAIANANRQGELNFHNLYVLSGQSTWRDFFKTGEIHYQQFMDAQNLFRLGFFSFFFIFPVFVMTPITHQSLNKIGYYRPPTYFTVLLIIFIVSSFLITIGRNNTLVHHIQELREMSYAIFIALYLYLFRANKGQSVEKAYQQ
jgi:hypothetical protein